MSRHLIPASSRFKAYLRGLAYLKPTASSTDLDDRIEALEALMELGPEADTRNLQGDWDRLANDFRKVTARYERDDQRIARSRRSTRRREHARA